jgi:hypothetical protein
MIKYMINVMTKGPVMHHRLDENNQTIYNADTAAGSIAKKLKQED